MWLASPFGSHTYYQVKDVYPARIGSVTIVGIYYYSGTTGRCVVVPYNVSNTDNEGLSIQQQNLLTGIRRGALVTLNSETCYVLGTAVAPDGTLSFEVVTTGTHAAGETLTGQPAIKVLLSSEFNGVTPSAPVAGNTLVSVFLQFNMGTGIGSIQSVLGTANPFSFQNISYRPSDYLHFAIGMNGYTLSQTAEIKILLDVSDGQFDQDFYFYAFRPSDIQAGISNTLTQLGGAQLVAQREAIDEESSLQGSTSSSSPLAVTAGTSPTGPIAYSDIYIPLSALTRVGTNQQLSLLNVNTLQVLVNLSGSGGANTNFYFGSIDLCGGFSPDLTESDPDYKYVIRPRSTVTGAIGNPCPAPRYGIRPRREEVQIVLPTTYVDSQVDTWDVFRVGGSITAYTFIGSAPLGSAYFYDNYADSDIVANEQLDYDNFQPWPTIDLPLNVSTVSSCGTTAIVTITNATTQANVLRYLPGNLVQLGQQVYTLWTRPTHISGNNYLFQFVENTGVALAAPVSFGNTSGIVNASEYATNITFNASQYQYVSPQLRTQGGVPPGTVTDYVIASGFGLSVPAGKFITSVEVTLNWVGQNSGTGLLTGVSLYHGGVQIGTAKTPNIPNINVPMNTTLGGDTWGATLTPAIINDATFGFGVQITTQLAGGSDRSFLDSFSVTVYYVSPPVTVSEPVSIYEPAMANQVLPYLWGPTELGGNIFGCGDPLRPGFVYFSKNFNPDSAPDNYNIELCPPSEPLLGGEVLNGNSYAASTERWWQLRPDFGGVNQFTPIEAPVGRGLAAPYGICTDGSKIYFVAKDGIWMTGGGPGESLTDADLYNLFPHEGIKGTNVTYNGVTTYAPDYGRASTFRLCYCNSYLYFDYQDTTGTARTLV
jgi:hypothetical protein